MRQKRQIFVFLVGLDSGVVGLYPNINVIREDSEGENPKSLVVTENYDPKLDSTMLVDLMS
jgi:hypothetical protein